MIRISQVLMYIFYNINYVQTLLDTWQNEKKKTQFLKQTKNLVH
jgi:hypothetical protein